MPIRPEMKDKYPANWKEIVEQVRERSGDTCEWCGVKNGDYGIHDGRGWRSADPSMLGCDADKEDWKAFWGAMPIQIVLTVAHLDHQPENCDLNNLRHLCQRCHNEYDAPFRAAGRKERAKNNMNLFDEGQVK